MMARIRKAARNLLSALTGNVVENESTRLANQDNTDDEEKAKALALSKAYEQAVERLAIEIEGIKMAREQQKGAHRAEHR